MLLKGEIFNPQPFVVAGSNIEDGGGSSAFVKEDRKPVSRHKNAACNAYVTDKLDLAAGDELFQVARFGVLYTALAYATGL
jgi:hypothetical protein